MCGGRRRGCTPRGVPVRDSKAPYGPAVIVPAPAWSAFVTAFVTAVGSGGFPNGSRPRS
uniref:DUF397 domain-containing protein n=1 Tax=Streptomyces sp. CHD11 TaxID=2741325 RepID=UPI0027E52BF7|nr:DUF397 domain-containing protein [Streptomyces sp. CHD11]